MTSRKQPEVPVRRARAWLRKGWCILRNQNHPPEPRLLRLLAKHRMPHGVPKVSPCVVFAPPWLSYLVGAYWQDLLLTFELTRAFRRAGRDRGFRRAVDTAYDLNGLIGVAHLAKAPQQHTRKPNTRTRTTTPATEPIPA